MLFYEIIIFRQNLYPIHLLHTNRVSGIIILQIVLFKKNIIKRYYQKTLDTAKHLQVKIIFRE